MKSISRIWVVASLLLSLGANADDPDDQALRQEAQQLVGQFVGQLKPTLKAAMEKGGPAEAIAVCAETAPAIAKSLSRESGWEVSRVSLQPRNQETARPDQWEREHLHQLADKREKGADASALNVAERVDGQYRYMQAQIVEPLCLNCHGQALSDEVTAALQRFYPQDTATGYSVGDVRGAISLRRALTPPPATDRNGD